MNKPYLELKLRSRALTMGVVLLGALGFSASATAQSGFFAGLKGLFESPPVATTGLGSFVATLNPEETALSYTLEYINLEGEVSQAHIHIGQPGVNGGVVLFLCTNLDPPAGVPAPPACPGPTDGAVTGTLTAADVVPVAQQGISAGDFAQVINAMRSNAAYVNVHSDQFPPGEIRGDIISGP